MAKTFTITDATITHQTAGVIPKEKITYYDGETIETIEIYSINGIAVNTIKEGYVNPDNYGSVDPSIQQFNETLI
jgi:uncharacterized protein YqfB (UPF0267 family)